MKKFLVFFGFFLLSSHLACWAAPWGMDPDYKPVRTQEEQKENAVGEGYLLRSFLQGKTVKLSLWIENERIGEFERFSRMLVQSYQSWFDNAAERIVQKGREQEFADVLPYLQRPLSIKVVREEDADLRVKVYGKRKKMQKDLYREEWKEYPNVFGMYEHGEKLISISKQRFLRSPKEILLHEIGHSLGFSDQYYIARWRADEVYSSNSLHNVMAGGDITKLTCDDADGLINLIDLTLGLDRGGEKGWKSLCSSSRDSYKGGMPTRTNRYRVEHREDDSLVIEEYENGKQISAVQFRFAEEEVSPFAIVEEESVLKRSVGGVPALVKGKNGEEIYYIREYERFEKIITKDGKLISHLYTYPIPPSHIGVLKKFRYKGEIGFLEGEVTMEMKPLGAIFSLPDKQIEFVVRFDKKRDVSIVEETWFGPWREIFSSNKSKEVLDTSLIEQSVFEQGVVEWAKIWPQYIHSGQR